MGTVLIADCNTHPSDYNGIISIVRDEDIVHVS